MRSCSIQFVPLHGLPWNMFVNVCFYDFMMSIFAWKFCYLKLWTAFNWKIYRNTLVTLATLASFVEAHFAVFAIDEKKKLLVKIRQKYRKPQNFAIVFQKNKKIKKTYKIEWKKLCLVHRKHSLFQQFCSMLAFFD